jgi:ribonuclease P protein component
VVRNRIRRRLRACVSAASLEPGVAVVLSASASSLAVPFEELRRAVEAVLASASSVGGPSSATPAGVALPDGDPE